MRFTCIFIYCYAKLSYFVATFLKDPWWNPAVEEQAVMRIHRIGQTKRVMIRRFIVKVSFAFVFVFDLAHVAGKCIFCSFIFTFTPGCRES
jgi:hypothetical protein